jgi:hypothetical protein
LNKFKKSNAYRKAARSVINYPTKIKSGKEAQNLVITNFTNLIMFIYQKTPLLVPGVDPFSNTNTFVWDQFIKEKKTDFKISTCLLFNLVLY